MKLKCFNPETCQAPQRTKDLVMVLRKNGAICFTKPTIEALKLNIGSKIELVLANDTDWYLRKVKNGFELKNLGQQIGFSCIHLLNIMWPGRKKEDKSVHLIISETPINYEGIDMYLVSFPKK